MLHCNGNNADWLQLLRVRIRAGETDAEVQSVPHSFKLDRTVHDFPLRALLNSNYPHLADSLHTLFGFPLTVTKGAATLHGIHAQQNTYESQ